MHQEPSKIDQERPKRGQEEPKTSFLMDFGVVLGLQNGFKRRAESAPDPSWRALGAKMTPRALQDSSEDDFGSILKQFWKDFSPTGPVPNAFGSD